VILTAMASYYLSAPGAATPGARAISRDLSSAIGPLLTPALLLFRLRRRFFGLTHGAYC
jgi:hypothetical protein